MRMIYLLSCFDEVTSPPRPGVPQTRYSRKRDSRLTIKILNRMVWVISAKLSDASFGREIAFGGVPEALGSKMAQPARRARPDGLPKMPSMPLFLAVTAVVTAAVGHPCAASAARSGLNPAATSDASCFVGPSAVPRAPAWGVRNARRDAVKVEQSLGADVSRSRWCDRGVVGVRLRVQRGSTTPGLEMSASSDEDDVSLPCGGSRGGGR